MNQSGGPEYLNGTAKVGFVDSFAQYGPTMSKANLYTYFLPSFLVLALFLHNRNTNAKMDTRYKYVGYRFWFEPTILLRLRFVFSGFDIVQDGYNRFTKLRGEPFWIRRNDADVLVLSTKYLKEIANFKRNQLSGIEALAFNVLGKFNGIDLWTRSDLHIRVLRTHVSAAMFRVMSTVQEEMNHVFGKHVPDYEEWEEIDIVSTLRRITAKLSARILLGFPACRDEEYIQMTLDYTNDVFVTTFFSHRFPSWVTPLVLFCMPARWRLSKHQDFARKTMLPMIKRYEDAVAVGAEDAEPPTLLNGMLKESAGAESRSLSTEDIVGSQMITSLASIHTTVLTTTYALLEICRHPELLAELREEAQEGFLDETLWGPNYVNRLPKLDSLIHECNRVHPPSILLPQRKAKVSFTLSNGLEIKEGTQFAFPLGPVANDPAIYPNPEEFDAMRSYRKRMASGGLNKGKDLASAPNEDYLVFGHGAQACPGRHLAINKVKIIVMYFLLNHEMKEPERQLGKKLDFPFEEYNMLDVSVRMMVRKKRAQDE